MTVTSFNGNDASSQTEIAVNFDGSVISDNMECTCAPTAKVTQIDLKIEPEATIVSGETTVTHDGSTEDCTQRIIVQQCHLRFFQLILTFYLLLLKVSLPFLWLKVVHTHHQLLVLNSFRF